MADGDLIDFPPRRPRINVVPPASPRQRLNLVDPYLEDLAKKDMERRLAEGAERARQAAAEAAAERLEADRRRAFKMNDEIDRMKFEDDNGLGRGEARYIQREFQPYDTDYDTPFVPPRSAGLSDAMPAPDVDVPAAGGGVGPTNANAEGLNERFKPAGPRKTKLKADLPPVTLYDRLFSSDVMNSRRKLASELKAIEATRAAATDPYAVKARRAEVDAEMDRLEMEARDLEDQVRTEADPAKRETLSKSATAKRSAATKLDQEFKEKVGSAYSTQSEKSARAKASQEIDRARGSRRATARNIGKGAVGAVLLASAGWLGVKAVQGTISARRNSPEGEKAAASLERFIDGQDMSDDDLTLIQASYPPSVLEGLSRLRDQGVSSEQVFRAAEEIALPPEDVDDTMYRFDGGGRPPIEFEPSFDPLEYERLRATDPEAARVYLDETEAKDRLAMAGVTMDENLMRLGREIGLPSGVQDVLYNIGADIRGDPLIDTIPEGDVRSTIWDAIRSPYMNNRDALTGMFDGMGDDLEGLGGQWARMPVDFIGGMVDDVGTSTATEMQAGLLGAPWRVVRGVGTFANGMGLMGESYEDQLARYDARTDVSLSPENRTALSDISRDAFRPQPGTLPDADYFPPLEPNPSPEESTEGLSLEILQQMEDNGFLQEPARALWERLQRKGEGIRQGAAGLGEAVTDMGSQAMEAGRNYFDPPVPERGDRRIPELRLPITGAPPPALPPLSDAEAFSMSLQELEAAERAGRLNGRSARDVFFQTRSINPVDVQFRVGENERLRAEARQKADAERTEREIAAKTAIREDHISARYSAKDAQDKLERLKVADPRAYDQLYPPQPKTYSDLLREYELMRSLGNIPAGEDGLPISFSKYVQGYTDPRADGRARAEKFWDRFGPGSQVEKFLDRFGLGSQSDGPMPYDGNPNREGGRRAEIANDDFGLLARLMEEQRNGGEDAFAVYNAMMDPNRVNGGVEGRIKANDRIKEQRERDIDQGYDMAAISSTAPVIPFRTQDERFSRRGIAQDYAAGKFYLDDRNTIIPQDEVFRGYLGLGEPTGPYEIPQDPNDFHPYQSMKERFSDVLGGLSQGASGKIQGMIDAASEALPSFGGAGVEDAVPYPVNGGRITGQDVPEMGLMNPSQDTMPVSPGTDDAAKREAAREVVDRDEVLNPRGQQRLQIKLDEPPASAGLGLDEMYPIGVPASTAPPASAVLGLDEMYPIGVPVSTAPPASAVLGLDEMYPIGVPVSAAGGTPPDGPVGDFRASRDADLSDDAAAADEELNWINRQMRDKLGLDATQRGYLAQALIAGGGAMVASDGNFLEALSEGISAGAGAYVGGQQADVEAEMAQAELGMKQENASRDAALDAIRLRVEQARLARAGTSSDPDYADMVPAKIREIEMLANDLYQDELLAGMTEEEKEQLRRATRARARRIVYDRQYVEADA